jgi:uncharacterized membrane protein
MKTPFLTAALAMSALAGMAAAVPTVEFVDSGFLITDLSQDGTIGAGNVQGDGSFETFRWTLEGGVQQLGRGSVVPLGIGGGSPDISYDGARISASIVSANGQFLTQGLWDIATGWTETMPPLPPDGLAQDQELGSAWGLSGDGGTLTGYYRGFNGRAFGSTWSADTGMVHVSQVLGSSVRVDAASFDGSVVCGWEDLLGPRLPTAWRNGVKFPLFDADGGGGGGAQDVTADGSIIVGSEYKESIITRVPTIWTWNGSSYDMQNLEFLPGTQINFGQAYLSTVSADGSIAGGSNVFTQNPGGPRTGIIWTPAGGVVDVVDYFDSIGITDQIPANFDIREVTAISPDGNAIAVIGLQNDTFAFQTMIVYLNNETACPGDTNGDNIVNFTDLNAVLAAFGESGEGLAGDVNGDGVVNFTDLNEVLANFGADCN